MTAKEMFEELGYECIVRKNTFRYRLYDPQGDELLIRISFNNVTKKFSINCLREALDIDELQAINKQIEELGWNND